MHKPLRWLILILVLAAVGFLIWRQTRPKPIEVRVRAVERGLVERTVVNTRAGTVKACRRAKLSPSVGGQIDKLPIKEGDQVKAGQLLLELWNKDLLAQEKAARSEVEVARARAQAAALNAEVAEREAQRLLALQKTGASAEDQTDRAVTQAKARRQESDAANAAVLTSEAKVAVIAANLTRTRLYAPFDGIVGEINGEVGEFVTPSPIGIPTSPVVDLIGNACFYVVAPIDEVDAAAVRLGMPARLSLDATGDRHYAGRVRRIADYVLDREKQARTVDVEVEFTSTPKDFQLLAGYSADAEIILEARHDVRRIPTEALLDGHRVFVFLADQHIIQERTLTVGISNWDYTEVLSGLELNESVVVNVDQAGVKDGAAAVLAQAAP